MSKIIISLVLTAMAALIGYLAQRSRMCFIGGFRDFLLVGDKELLMGTISLITALWLLTSVFYSQGWLSTGVAEYGDTQTQVKQIESPGEDADADGIPVVAKEERSHTIIPVYPYIPEGKFVWISLSGGFLLGIMSVLAGGCVLRQHVMAAQGNGDAWYFLLGLYIAVLAYDFLLRPFVDKIYL